MFIGRWIALVRFAVAWLAGIDHMHFRTFFVYNALGAITWAITFGLVGYYAGKAAADAITKYGVYAAVALVALIVAFVVWRVVRERRLRKAAAADVAARRRDGGDGTRSSQRPSDRQPAAVSRSSAQELMQNRCPVGFGPSSNTWPRWPPQRLQRTSVRAIPRLRSSCNSTFSATAGS